MLMYFIFFKPHVIFKWGKKLKSIVNISINIDSENHNSDFSYNMAIVLKQNMGRTKFTLGDTSQITIIRFANASSACLYNDSVTLLLWCPSTSVKKTVRKKTLCNGCVAMDQLHSLGKSMNFLIISFAPFLTEFSLLSGSMKRKPGNSFSVGLSINEMGKYIKIYVIQC